jgi:hypothetical protein
MLGLGEQEEEVYQTFEICSKPMLMCYHQPIHNKKTLAVKNL